MLSLREKILECAKETGFSGVVGIQSGASWSFAEAFGFRDRANELANQLSTRFGIASGTKGFTAVGIAALVEQKLLHFATPANHILGESLKNLDPDITVAQLLGHTSGIGDYLDEEKIQDFEHFVLAAPVQNLVSPFDYVPLIEKEAQKFPPGTRFSYSNSGYIVLAMIIELVSGQPYQDFIGEQVFTRAGMVESGFFRSDDLPGDTALGYIQDEDSWRTNVFHLPVRGGGDGGAYTTIGDMQKFWQRLKSFRLASAALVSEMLQPQPLSGSGNLKHSCGFWIDESANQLILEGCDAGASFRSATDLKTDDGYTIMSNTSSGAWPLVRVLTPFFQQEHASG